MVGSANRQSRLSHPINGPSLIPRHILSNQNTGTPRSNRPVIDPYKAFTAEDLDGFVNGITSKIRNALLGGQAEDVALTTTNQRSFNAQEDDVFGRVTSLTQFENSENGQRSLGSVEASSSVELNQSTHDRAGAEAGESFEEEHLEVNGHLSPGFEDENEEEEDDEDEGKVEDDEDEEDAEEDEEEDGDGDGEEERQEEPGDHSIVGDDQELGSDIEDSLDSNRVIDPNILEEQNLPVKGSAAPPVYEIDSSSESSQSDDSVDDGDQQQEFQILDDQSEDEDGSDYESGEGDEPSEAETQAEEEVDYHTNQMIEDENQSGSDSDAYSSTSSIEITSERSPCQLGEDEANSDIDCSESGSQSPTHSDGQHAFFEDPQKHLPTFTTNPGSPFRTVDLHALDGPEPHDRSLNQNSGITHQTNPFSQESLTSTQKRHVARVGSFTANGTMIFRPPSETFEDVAELDDLCDLEFDVHQTPHEISVEQEIREAVMQLEASGSSLEVPDTREDEKAPANPSPQRPANLEMSSLIDLELIEDEIFKTNEFLIDSQQSVDLGAMGQVPDSSQADIHPSPETEELEVQDDNDLFEGDNDLRLHRLGEMNSNRFEDSRDEERGRSPVLGLEPSQNDSLNLLGSPSALSQRGDKFREFLRQVEESGRELFDSHNEATQSNSENPQSKLEGKGDVRDSSSKEEELSREPGATEAEPSKNASPSFNQQLSPGVSPAKTQDEPTSLEEKAGEPPLLVHGFAAWGDVSDSGKPHSFEQENFMETVPINSLNRSDLSSKAPGSWDLASADEKIATKTLKSQSGSPSGKSGKSPSAISFSLPKQSDELRSIKGFDDTEIGFAHDEVITDRLSPPKTRPEEGRQDQEDYDMLASSSSEDGGEPRTAVKDIVVPQSTEDEGERNANDPKPMEPDEVIDVGGDVGEKSMETGTIFKTPLGPKGKKVPATLNGNFAIVTERSSETSEKGPPSAVGFTNALKADITIQDLSSGAENHSILQKFLNNVPTEVRDRGLALKPPGSASEGTSALAVKFASSPPTEMQNPPTGLEEDSGYEEGTDVAIPPGLIPLTIEPQTPVASTTQGQRTPSELSERFPSRGPASFVTWSAPSSVVSSGALSSPASVAPPPPLPSASMGAPTEAVGLANQMSRRSSVDSSTHAEPPSPSTSTRQRSAPITQEQVNAPGLPHIEETLESGTSPQGDLPNPLEPPPLMDHLAIPSCQHSNSPHASQASSIVAQPPSPSFTTRVSESRASAGIPSQLPTMNPRPPLGLGLDANQPIDSGPSTAPISASESQAVQSKELPVGGVPSLNDGNSSSALLAVDPPRIEKENLQAEARESSSCPNSLNGGDDVAAPSNPPDPLSEIPQPQSQDLADHTTQDSSEPHLAGSAIRAFPGLTSEQSSVQLNGNSLTAIKEDSQPNFTGAGGDLASVDSFQAPSPGGRSVVESEITDFSNPETISQSESNLFQEIGTSNNEDSKSELTNLGADSSLDNDQPQKGRRRSSRKRKYSQDQNFTLNPDDLRAANEEELKYEAKDRTKAYQKRTSKRANGKARGNHAPAESSPALSNLPLNAEQNPPSSSDAKKAIGGRKRSRGRPKKSLASDVELESNLGSELTEIEESASPKVKLRKTLKKGLEVGSPSPRTPSKREPGSSAQKGETNRAHLPPPRRASRLKPASVDSTASDEQGQRRMSLSVVVPPLEASIPRSKPNSKSSQSTVLPPSKTDPSTRDDEEQLEKGIEVDNSEPIIPMKRLHQHNSKGNLLFPPANQPQESESGSKPPAVEEKILEKSSSPGVRTPKRKQASVEVEARQLPQSLPPVTRSHCHFVKLTFKDYNPEDEGRVEGDEEKKKKKLNTFLVPQCSTGTSEIKQEMKDLGVTEDHNVTAEEQSRSVKIGGDGKIHSEESGKRKAHDFGEEFEVDELVMRGLIGLIGPSLFQEGNVEVLPPLKPTRLEKLNDKTPIKSLGGHDHDDGDHSFVDVFQSGSCGQKRKYEDDDDEEEEEEEERDGNYDFDQKEGIKNEDAENGGGDDDDDDGRGGSSNGIGFVQSKSGKRRLTGDNHLRKN